MQRWTSSLSFLPPRRARWGLTSCGRVSLAQGLGKALDPDGYLAALAAFHVLEPAPDASAVNPGFPFGIYVQEGFVY